LKQYLFALPAYAIRQPGTVIIAAVYLSGFIARPIEPD
jgi:hypothetical protein